MPGLQPRRALAVSLVLVSAILPVGATEVFGGAQPAGEVRTVPSGSSVSPEQLDGEFGSEWSDAATFSGPLFHDFNNPSTVFPTEIRMKHDGTNLYWALQIERPEELFTFWFFSMFDHDGDGVVFGEGDDYQVVRVKGTIPALIDMHVDSGSNIQRDIDFGGTQELLGGGAETASGGGTIYRIEASHPLNSGDTHDVAWSPGDEVAIVFGSLGLEDTGPAGSGILPQGVTQHVAKNGDENDGDRYVLGTEEPTPTSSAVGNSTIIIQKSTEGDDPRQFCFFSDLLGSFCMSGGSTRAFTGLPPGEYTFSEDFAPGWFVSGIGCSPPTVVEIDLGLRRVTVDLGPNQTVTCGYINSLDPSPTPTPTATPPPEETPTPTPNPISASFTIRKTVVAGDDSERFDFEVDGPFVIPDFDLADGQQQRERVLDGSYVAREVVPPGWVVEAIVCDTISGEVSFISDVASATVSFTLGKGASIICEFKNRQVPDESGVIRIWKRALGPEGPGADEFGFVPSANLSPAPFNLADGESQEFVVPPGEYSVQEEVPDGWLLHSIVCVASDGTTFVVNSAIALVLIFLGGGDVIDCFFVNRTDDSAVIEIAKTVLLGNHGQPFEFEPSPNLSPDNFVLYDLFFLGTKLFFVSPGNYSVRELVPPGWALYDILCETDSGSSVTISGTQVNIQLGEDGDVFCDYGNVEVADTHYKCYNIAPVTNPDTSVDMETLFGLESGAEVGDSRYLCPPALKTRSLGEPEGDLESSHIECYAIDSSDDPDVAIDLFTQFDQDGFQAIVGLATMLCTPVDKTLTGAPDPGDQQTSPRGALSPVPHYKCYEIGGSAPGVLVDIETQFGLETAVEVGEPLYFCASAVKTHGGESFGRLGLPHQVCYEIEDEPVNVVVRLNSQFGSQSGVQVLDPDLLCTPATTGPTLRWGDVGCAGDAFLPGALLLLRQIGGDAPENPPGCPAVGDDIGPGVSALSASLSLLWGDMNCDGEVSTEDVIIILSHVAGVPYPLAASCPVTGKRLPELVS